MKKKERDELKTKSADQLSKQIAGLVAQIANTRMEQQTKTKNVHAQNAKRRDIARMATIMNAKLQAERNIKNAAK